MANYVVMFNGRPYGEVSWDKEYIKFQRDKLREALKPEFRNNVCAVEQTVIED